MNPMPVVTDKVSLALELYPVPVLFLESSSCETGELPRRRTREVMTYRFVVTIAVLLASELWSCVLQQPHICRQGYKTSCEYLLRLVQLDH